MNAIICGGKTGRAVIYGEVDELPAPDSEVTIKNARMVLRWDKACGGLLGLAARGPREDTRITSTVLTVRDVARQSIEVTLEAADAIDAWPNYR